MKRTDLPALTLFALVVEYGGFRAAARALSMSPSAVSQEVSQLERRLGQRLLTRTTRSVALTPAGTRLLDYLKPALSGIEQGLAELEQLKDLPSGRVRVSMPQSAAVMIFVPRLAEFYAAFPQVEVELSGHNAFIDIVAEGFDVGVRLGESLAPDMIAVPVSGHERLVVVASPALMARWGVPRDPADLQSMPCIRQRMPGGKIYDWELERDGRAVTVAVDGPLIGGDDRIVLDAARAGLGFACLIGGWIEPYLENGELQPVLEDWCPKFPGFFLYYPDKRLRPAVRAFVEFFRTQR